MTIRFAIVGLLTVAALQAFHAPVAYATAALASVATLLVTLVARGSSPPPPAERLLTPLDGVLLLTAGFAIGHVPAALAAGDPVAIVAVAAIVTIAVLRVVRATSKNRPNAA